MNFFTKRVPWATWQFSLLKLSMLAMGILVGTYFADLWRPYLWLVWLIFLVTATWVSIIWLRAVRRRSPPPSG